MLKKQYVAIFFGLLLIGWLILMIWIYMSALQTRSIRKDEIRPADAALVLGNAVNKDGRPNPCLRSRVAAAAELYHADKVPKLVVAGGTDSDGSNEAQHMKAIAIELGVPESRIAMEGKSENTYENIRFSSVQLTNNSNVVIVSADFHLQRALWLAEREWGDQKMLQVYSGQESCDDSGLDYARKLVRESLAWIKAVVIKPD
ncbi:MULTISPECIES: YdcF family protein [unclassified Neisseria]|uniref:YdcF family protein n=1 Tax=unclassified Neisseria TaxID=2623750 RepID=UPI0026665FB2|nr:MULTISPECIES: YdcF family protein [unclassified Neisseria]MDO1509697.1 YdcF family protein [Neisseria sp. MVDL19-042950]MDO1515979.1 YdcF family protein [Neisseria sp. MVDL18-041461]MDO1563092.1 YdcF family protein [Neisseria sp. MVDL20-010259]